MPNRTAEKLRAICARLVLTAMRETAKARNAPTNYEDVMIRLAVVVAQAERRPLTASKLAPYVDLPRTTVLRRVAAMVAGGVMAQDMNRKTLTIPEEFLNSGTAMEACIRVSRMINAAAEALSKLDTEKIAHQKSSRQMSTHSPGMRNTTPNRAPK
jgi:hypothetical protein